MRNILVGGLGAGATILVACVAPIATRSSPEHTTHVEVENATEENLAISVEMVEGVGKVSYDGRLRPGEIESLYVRNGADYEFTVTDPSTGQVKAERLQPVWAYTNLVYDGVQLVVSDRTVEVPPSERVLPAPNNALAPFYVGGLSSGFSIAPGSAVGDGTLTEDKTTSVVFGLSGETRMFSDYLALNGNLGYSPAESFHTAFVSFGPMIKFAPYERVDPYVLFNVGVAGFFSRGDKEFEDGEDADIKGFGNLVLDYGGGMLLGLTSHFTMDLQIRIHNVRLDPMFYEETEDFPEETLFSEDSSIFPEFRVGIRYAPGS